MALYFCRLHQLKHTIILTNVNVDQIIFNNGSDDFCHLILDKLSEHLVTQTVIWLEFSRCPSVISGPDNRNTLVHGLA